MKRIRFILLSLVLFSSCRPSADEYVNFLYESMPLPDSLVFSRDYWQANVEKTLEVRDRMGWNVPEREFRHFVLPLRVNNENLDDFRTVYADSLCARVQGMSMADAALEINHWCHERATYVPSDGRTLGPMALIRSGLGRCGEESVLAVAALRAAGLPARQVYTPRWAHTDDNHAWVEVYVDGKWHFMGACEPEPVLDLAWFNSSVSRAMLLHTKVFGNYNGPEDVISRTSAYTEINCIKSYIPTRRTHVVIRDNEGNPVQGADVKFCIYNYAEFYPVAWYQSDAHGMASLDTGIGDVVVWASKGDKFGLAVVPGYDAENGFAQCDAEHPAVVVLERTLGQSYSIDLDIVPPVEDPLPNMATAEQTERNIERLAEEDRIRLARPHPRTADPGLFLSAKDAIDVDPEVISEAMAMGLSGNPYIDSPRVELEMLMPFRQAFLDSDAARQIDSLVYEGSYSSYPSAIAAWIQANIRLEKGRNPQGLRIPPLAVLQGRIADSRSRDIFFVAACRAMGCAARLDEATSRPEYCLGDDEPDNVASSDKWVAVDFEAGNETLPDQSVVNICYERAIGSPVRTPQYYYNYTLSRISDGVPVLCEYDENAPARSSYLLDKGYYMLTSGTRLANGSVLAHVELFCLNDDVSVPLILRSAVDKVQVMGSINAEQTFLAEGAEKETTILSNTGRGYFMLAITGVHDEPTSHALGQFSDLSAELNDWGRKIIVLDGKCPEGLDNVVYGRDVNGKIRDMISAGVELDGPLTLPVVVIADSFGRVVYLSRGYNTSMTSQIRNVLQQL